MRHWSAVRFCLLTISLLLISGMVSADTAAPVASFTSDISSGVLPLTVSFTDTSTNGPDGRAWFFGDENYTEGWTSVKENNADGWSGRYDHTSVVTLNGTILLMGGAPDPSIRLNDTWASVDNGATWSLVNASSGWSPRGSFSSVVLSDGSIVIMGGGFEWSSNCQNDVWRSIDNGTSWTRQNASAGWSKRWGHTSVALPDGSIVLMGGYDSSFVGRNDVWRSTDKGVTWTQQNASAGWVNVQQSTSAVLQDGSILVMGGGSSIGTGWLNNVWRSADKGATWTQLPDAGWSGRGALTSVVMPDGSIVLMGGANDGGTWNDVWRSADNGTTWTQLPDAAWPGRAQSSGVVASDGSIVILGGSTNEGYGNDVWRFAPAGSVTVNPSHTYTEPGSYAVALRSYNAGGFNTSRKTGYITVTPPPAPTVNGITPASRWANTSAISSVNLSGTAFAAGATARLNRTGYADIAGTNVTVISSTDISCTFDLTNAMIGQYNVVVTDRWGQDGMLAGGFTLVPPPVPVVTGITPAGSANQSGFGITDLAGTHFAAGDSVTLNRTGVPDILGTAVTVVSPTKITCTMDLSHAMIGNYNIVVTDRYNQSGILADGFTVYAPARPIPAFSGTSAAGYRSGTAPLNITFTDTSVLNPAGRAWYFGDENYTQPWTDLWSAGATTYPSRFLHTSAAMPDGSVILMGGHRGQYRNDTWRSTDGGVNWLEVNASSGWSKRVSPTSVAMPDGSIVLMGGLDTNYHTLNDVWRSTDNGATWARVNAGAGWSGRSGHTSVVMPDGSIVLMGGSGDAQFNDVWRSADKGATWTQVTPDAGWSGRNGHTSVVMPDGSIILMGGLVNSGAIYNNDTWRSTDGGATWTQVNASSGWSGRYGHTSVAMPDGSIVLMGGMDRNSNYLHDVWRSTDNGTTWTPLPGAGWPARYGHTSVVLHDGGILLMGGLDSWGIADAEWRLSTASSSVQNPSHTYTAPGIYPVTLQAYNSYGYNSTRKTGYVLVPAFDLEVRDLSTNNSVVTGKSVPYGDQLEFEITASPPGIIENISAERGIPSVPFSITLTGPDGSTVSSVIDKQGTVTPLGNIQITSSPSLTGGIWDSGNALYRTGTYTARTGSTLAGMEGMTPSRSIVLSNSPVPVPKAPAIGTVPTTSGYRNGTTAFTLTGSNFQPGPGNTTVEFRNKSTGMIETTLTSVTATRIDGTVAIPGNTVTGPWNIRVVTADGGEMTKAGAFSIVNLSKPTIVSMTPTGPYFRNQTVNYTITGTNFEPDKTTVLLRNKAGDALNGSVAVDSGVWLVTPAKICGTVTVPFEVSSATPFNITVTTLDGGTVARENAFTIPATLLKPTITAITPATPWYRNATLKFLITGTNFQPGQTTVTFSYPNNGTPLNSTHGFTVDTITATTINGTIVIPCNASAGAINISVTTLDGGRIWKPAAVSVAGLVKPSISTVTPAAPWYRNATVRFLITGSNFQPGQTTVTFSYPNNGTPLNSTHGFTINTITATTINGSIVIPCNASAGSINVSVTTLDGGKVWKAAAFTVAGAQKPSISTVTPATPWYRNATVKFLITGTNFQPGQTTVTFSYPNNGTPLNSTHGFTINTITATTINGSIVIPCNASAGAINVSVTTLDGGRIWKPAAVSVAGLVKPSISTVTPAAPWYRNATVRFLITGTNFQPGQTTVTFSYPNNGTPLNSTHGFTVDTITATTINGSIVIPCNASAGSINLSVTTLDGGKVWKAAAFTVAGAQKPTISTVTPATPWYRNATLKFLITGTNFQPGQTTVTFSYPNNGTPLNSTHGFTVDTITATTINGTIVIPCNASAGAINVSVTTLDGGKVWKAAAFNVAGAQKPSISTVTPAAPWYRNATVKFLITGTNFQPGQTTVTISYPNNGTPLNSTHGFTVDTITATTINGSIVIPCNASAGSINVSVTTLDGGKIWKPSAFSIARFPAPVISSITPTSGFRNSTVPFTITGSNFQPGLTTVDMSTPAYGELNTTIYSITATRIIGGVALPSDAPASAWKLNVTTLDGGTTTRASAFTVGKVQRPSITSFSPANAYRGTTITFTLTGTSFQTDGRTTVSLTNASGYNITTTLSAVYPATITGTATLPSDAATGPWKANVTTVDGGTGTKLGAVTLL